jgi:hypothetical protein
MAAATPCDSPSATRSRIDEPARPPPPRGTGAALRGRVRVAVPASIAARLARLEQAEERRELEYWTGVLSVAYELDAGEVREVLIRAIAACKRCERHGDDTLRRSACIVRELDLGIEPAAMIAHLGRWAECRARGLSDEQIVRLHATEQLQEREGS